MAIWCPECIERFAEENGMSVGHVILRLVEGRSHQSVSPLVGMDEHAAKPFLDKSVPRVFPPVGDHLDSADSISQSLEVGNRLRKDPRSTH